MRAAIYVRISRDRAGAGLGCDRQEADCRQLAERLGMVVTEVYRDNDLSASRGRRRPGYQDLLRAIEDGEVDAVLAWHTDRLHRSPTELETWIGVCDRRDTPTHTVQAGPLDLATPAGRLVARQLGAVARYEVEHAGARARAAKAQLAASGQWRGGPRPYGYESDGMTVREDEAEVVRGLYRELLAGASLRGVTQRLNESGRVTSTGKTWRTRGVKQILLRARNAGLVETGGEIVARATWPAIIDEDTWRAVRALLSDPARWPAPPARRWMLSGLVRCWKCGQTVACTLSSRTAIHVYSCRDRHCGRHAEHLDRYVSDLVVARLSRADAVEALTAARDADDQTGALYERLDALRARLDGLAAMYAEGSIDAAQLAAGTRTLRERIEAVERQLTETPRGEALAGVVGSEDIRQAWESLPLDRKRAIIATLMTVTLKPARKGRPKGHRAGESYFDPDAVEVVWLT